MFTISKVSLLVGDGFFIVVQALVFAWQSLFALMVGEGVTITR
jgi:hypothetical protein